MAGNSMGVYVYVEHLEVWVSEMLTEQPYDSDEEVLLTPKLAAVVRALDELIELKRLRRYIICENRVVLDTNAAWYDLPVHCVYKILNDHFLHWGAYVVEPPQEKYDSSLLV